MSVSMMALIPPAPHLCQQCAVDHPPEIPHNQQSLYWGSWFMMTHGREPTWADAMAHCDDATREAWTPLLEEKGAVIGEVWGGKPWSEAMRRLFDWMAGVDGGGE